MQQRPEQTASTQFVILQHTTQDGEHWDLLLQKGGVLLTWQLTQNPTIHCNFPISARKLPDHRLFYLTHEGAVSGDRGSVARVASGNVTFETVSPDLVRFTLDADNIRGSFSLLRKDEDLWQLENF